MPRTTKRPTLTPAEVRTQWKTYFSDLHPPARRAVKQILAAIYAAAPKATPVFSYRIPGYRLLDQPLLWSAGFKNHVSLYPITARLRATHATALKGYKTSAGTVQFPLDKPLPVPLVRRLIKGRLAEVRSTASKRQTKARRAAS